MQLLVPTADGVIVTVPVPVPLQSPDAVMVTSKVEEDEAVAVKVDPIVLLPGEVKLIV